VITFFRHIRQSLLQQNQVSRYFKYAIGEILLVVIGILIALQINNWNENRKAMKEQRALLTDIITNLKRDSTSIQILVNNRDRLIELHQDLIDVVNGKKSSDEAGNIDLVRRSIPRRLTTKYNHPNLSSQVFDKEVKSAVLSYYESIDAFEFVMSHYNEIIENKMRPYLGEKKLLNYGNQFDFGERELINRTLFFEELQHKETQQVLFEVGVKLTNMIDFFENVKRDNEALKETIKTYLEK